MSKTYIRNAQVYTEHSFVKKTILIDDGRLEILPEDFVVAEDADVCIVCADGLKAVPGFIDIHTHGGDGVDVNDADKAALAKLARFKAAHGTTSFLASILTDTEEKTLELLGVYGDAACKQAETCGAELLGVHLEGPFLASEYKGAMPESLLKAPCAELLTKYQEASGGAVKYITISPELEGADALIREAKDAGIVVSIGHSGATYDETMKAIEAGASCGTHVGNAMRLIHQHEPGIFGALLESDCYCEIIADGIHLHPGTVSMLAKVKGTGRLIAITDSIMAAGLPDGEYKLGVNDVVVTSGDAKLKSDGTRAGSTLSQDVALKNIISFTGLQLEDVLPMLTENPAKLIGVYDRKGSLESGKDADIVLLSEENDIVSVYSKGEKVK